MKKLACRLGRHEWRTSVEGGQTFKVCAACGTTRDSRRSGSELEQSDMMGMSEEPPGCVGPKVPGGRKRAWTVIRMTGANRAFQPRGFGSKEMSRAIP
jgi:hypothetical protein